MGASHESAIANSFGFRWTTKRAETAFDCSNLIGMTAASFLLASAVRNMNRPKSERSVTDVVFPCLLAIDLCVRYPLLIGNWSTRAAILMFVAFYVVIATVQAYPFMKKWNLAFFCGFAALVLTWVLGTRKEKTMYAT